MRSEEEFRSCGVRSLPRPRPRRRHLVGVGAGAAARAGVSRRIRWGPGWVRPRPGAGRGAGLGVVRCSGIAESPAAARPTRRRLTGLRRIAVEPDGAPRAGVTGRRRPRPHPPPRRAPRAPYPPERGLGAGAREQTRLGRVDRLCAPRTAAHPRTLPMRPMTPARRDRSRRRALPTTTPSAALGGGGRLPPWDLWWKIATPSRQRHPPRPPVALPSGDLEIQPRRNGTSA